MLIVPGNQVCHTHEGWGKRRQLVTLRPQEEESNEKLFSLLSLYSPGSQLMHWYCSHLRDIFLRLPHLDSHLQT